MLLEIYERKGWDNSIWLCRKVIGIANSFTPQWSEIQIGRIWSTVNPLFVHAAKQHVSTLVGYEWEEWDIVTGLPNQGKAG